MICMICSGEFTKLKVHLKNVHSLEHELYYQRYINHKYNSHCDCGEKNKFYNAIRGYTKFCSRKCNLIAAQKIGVPLLQEYSQSELGKRKSSQLGKIAGPKALLQYNKSEKQKVHLRSDKNKIISKKASELFWSDDSNKLIMSERISKRNLIDWAAGKFKDSKIGYGKSGYVVTKKFGKIFFRSSYEEHFLSLLDNLDSIVDLKRESVRIPYGTKTFIPDYLINNSIICEIKPSFKIKLDLDNTLNKFEAAKQYCIAAKMKWLVLTEEDLFVSNPITHLSELLCQN